ncbi:tetratricopeptide (TPR) repeat protein [Pseudomonas sp. TE12234]
MILSMQNKSQAVVAESSFLKIVNDDSVKRTYVIFSSIDIEPGKFMFWRVMDSIAGSKIFLNDEKNGWYVHGIPTLGDNVPDAAVALLNLIKSTNPEEVVFIGPSMGAYGAMLYGSILKPELSGVTVRCLSFGGEFLLYGRETRSKAFTKKEHNLNYADLRGILKDSGLAVTHVYGDTDINDIYQSTLVEDNINVVRIAIKSAPHAVSTYIGQEVGLIEFVREFGESGVFPEFQSSAITQIGGFGSSLFKGHLALIDGEIESALHELGVAVSLCQDHAVARHKYGIALFQNGKLEEAFLEQSEAVRLNPSLDNAHYHLGVLLRERGELAEANLAFRECRNINPLHVVSRFALANDAVERNDFDEATEFLGEILKADARNVRAQEMLLRIERDVTERAKLSEIFISSNVFASKPIDSKPQLNKRFVGRDFLIPLMALKTFEMEMGGGSQDECEQLIKRATEHRDWITVVGVGRLMVKKWPMKYRGYLAQFDGLLNLELRYDAIQILALAVSEIGSAPLIAHRQMRLFNYSARWDLTLQAFRSDASVQTDGKCIREAFLAALQMKDFDLADSIVESSKFSEELHKSLAVELARNKNECAEELLGVTQCMGRGQRFVVAEAVASGNSKVVELACWKMYRDGVRDEFFFDVACRTLAHEDVSSRRSFFFQYAANSAHPQNVSYLMLLASSCLAWRLFEEARIFLNGLSNMKGEMVAVGRKFAELNQAICRIQSQFESVGYGIDY